MKTSLFVFSFLIFFSIQKEVVKQELNNLHKVDYLIKKTNRKQMKESFKLVENFPVKPSVIYRAWLDSDEHTAMTGSSAKCSNKLGETFSAWNNYITGKNISLVVNKKIVQNWRTTDFKDTDEDSELIILLEETNNGCELTLIHKNIPAGLTAYKKGWVNQYFIPMKNYFKTK
ncbi:SRPBCC domain-containing protein [Psychroserpens algicola]|uniref:SRPBCC domain-containing protein n=1 Tax=Psychroserpens algicola TaxID=1719034 RepID=A0ABT0H603_9FLAO|nr:SRPBCC domain-containing protein [Psychroserpens algicola]MCK8479803.1 SRPBCC domain-containing protein [Psychroserpens algicola]